LWEGDFNNAEKFQIPISKSQTNSNFQYQNFKYFIVWVIWILKTGACLEFGAWYLGFKDIQLSL
jgi:hypothetical protein